MNLNSLLYIPKSSFNGFVFSGSWATILMSSLKDIGITVADFRKDELKKTDILTICNAKGETQTIRLKAFSSMNVVKFKKMIRIAVA